MPQAYGQTRNAARDLSRPSPLLFTDNTQDNSIIIRIIIIRRVQVWITNETEYTTLVNVLFLGCLSAVNLKYAGTGGTRTEYVVLMVVVSACIIIIH